MLPFPFLSFFLTLFCWTFIKFTVTVLTKQRNLATSWRVRFSWRAQVLYIVSFSIGRSNYWFIEFSIHSCTFLQLLLLSRYKGIFEFFHFNSFDFIGPLFQFLILYFSDFKLLFSFKSKHFVKLMPFICSLYSFCSKVNVSYFWKLLYWSRACFYLCNVFLLRTSCILFKEIFFWFIRVEFQFSSIVKNSRSLSKKLIDVFSGIQLVYSFII